MKPFATLKSIIGEEQNKYDIKENKKMKKNLIALITVTALLASGAAVSAEDNQSALTEVNTIQENVIIPSYISNTVVVKETTDDFISAVSAASDDSEIDFTVDENTLVYDSNGNKKTSEDIKTEDIITVYTDSSLPAPLILPPQYTASVIIIEREDGFNVNVDTFLKKNETLITVSNTLDLNIAEETVIVDTDENELTAEDIENKNLIVFYGASTKSIPAQTTPEKIVVIGETEENTGELNDGEIYETTVIDFSNIGKLMANGIETDGFYENENGVLMVPLRKITEALEYDVEWNGENKSVMINNGIYSLKIGENSYVKGKAMPIELDAAPEIKENYTYVPVSYFSEVLELNLSVSTDENEKTLDISE